MTINWKTTTFLMLAAVTVFTGCTKSDKEDESTVSGNQLVTTEPATIKILTSTSMDEEFFRLYFKDPVKKKYPHITVESVVGVVSDVPKWMATGTIPDVILDFNGAMADKINYGLLEDITPLVKKHNIDLGRFDPVILDAVKIATKTEELYGLPYGLNFNALYYNKDIFDRFAVPYPKDGMTWDQTIELAIRLSRSDNGIAYKGLHYEHIARLSMALSPDFVNRKTERANVNNDTWKKIFELGYRINAIPGNKPAKVDSGSQDAFYKTQDTAMLASINTIFVAEEPIKNGLRIGIAQYPSYPERPNTYGYVDAAVMLIAKTSKYKDQAMQVLDAATSDEAQLAVAMKIGKVSVLKNPEMKTKFGSEIQFLKGVELGSIFKSNPAPAPAFSVYSLNARSLLQAKYKEYVDGKIDVNTALKLAEEEINKMIDTEMKK